MKYLITLLVFVLHFSSLFCKNYKIPSPNSKLMVTVSDNEGISFTVFKDSKLLFSVEKISLEFDSNVELNKPYKIKKTEQRVISEVIIPEFSTRTEKIEDKYNGMTLDFNNGIFLIFRVYDNGIAYRFNTKLDNEIVIINENVQLNLAVDDSLWCQSSKEFSSSYETPYKHYAINKLPENELHCLPMLVQRPDGKRFIFSESSLTDYPGMWIKHAGENPQVIATFPGVPSKLKTEGSPYSIGSVVETENYICKSAGTRDFPWRIVAIAENDKEIIENQLVYILSEKCKLADVSWIKPGKVIFDWWARHNIYGVDFKGGVNTATTKYYIDFCAKYGFEYFMFDDGWADNRNILNYSKDLNMEEIAAYAHEKNVGLMAWLMWSTFDRQMTEVFDKLEKWGFKGIKVDFMNRDDQQMVNFYEKVASEAAKRKMIVDFHGAFKPAGLHRSYPNVLTCEGLIEFEYNGWTNNDTPDHHNLLPYIRMFAGPMDYIPGTVNNATKDDFRQSGEYPMGQGTRAHFIALAVILESPLMMLPDSPSDYYREDETTRFLSIIPVTWDEVKILEAKAGDYTILARRKGNSWYIGAITDWTPRDFELKFDFLGDGNYILEFIEDGLNADKRATDYKLKSETITKSNIKTISLAAGGGWIARIIKE